MSIVENYSDVLERIALAAARSRRSPETITLVAVTKTWPSDIVIEAFQAGMRHFGENRPEEMVEKQPEVLKIIGKSGSITWHAIGALQSRKSNLVADHADVFHALDRMKIARRLSNRLEENGRVEKNPLPIFIEVNVSGESSKAGVNCTNWENDSGQKDSIAQLAKNVAELPGLRPMGLMTMAPWQVEEGLIRRVFERTRRLSEWLQSEVEVGDWSGLSMGMTDDYEIAIEEGATHIRVGRAIFGSRL